MNNKNPIDCTCEFVHRSSPTCQSKAPSRGAIKDEPPVEDDDRAFYEWYSKYVPTEPHLTPKTAAKAAWAAAKRRGM